MQVPDTGSERSQLIGQFSAETLQRMASNIFEESLANPRREVDQIRRSRGQKQSTIQLLEDGLVFEGWLLNEYPEVHKVKERLWRAD